jgi:hypothetical protein
MIEQFYRIHSQRRARSACAKKKPAGGGLGNHMAGAAKRMPGRHGGLIGGPNGVMRGSIAGDGVW